MTQYRQQQRAKEFGVNQLYFTSAMKRRVKAQFGGKCFNCGSTRRLHIDHHFPLSLGYPLEFGNACLLCFHCNCSKGTKLPSDFYTPEQLVILTQMLAKQRTWTDPK